MPAPRPFRLAELVERISKGTVALPEFQRDYKWTSSFAADLLRSVVNEYPIGTFLFFEQVDRRVIPSRKLASGPRRASVPRYLVLDGQQRLTVLYEAFAGHGRFTPYIDFNAFSSVDDFTDEAIQAITSGQFSRRFGNAVGRWAGHRILPFKALPDTDLTEGWIDDVASDRAEQRRLARIRDDILRNFVRLEIDAVVLDQETPLRAVAKIYERTNRDVVRLDAFDLMVAVTFSSRFNLRKKWSEAKERYPDLEFMRTSAGEPLRLIALREHLGEREERNARATDDHEPFVVGGVRQEDVLDVEASIVRREWVPAVHAYARALRFLARRCGVIRSNFLPQRTMVLAIADALYDRARPTAGVRRKLERWFWASVFSRRYAAGANTRVVTDAEELRRWLSGGAVPEAVREFSLGGPVLTRAEPGVELVRKGVACLLVHREGTDWSRRSAEYPHGPAQLRNLPTDVALDLHHIFAKAQGLRVADLPFHENAPVNVAVINDRLNQSIRDTPPREVCSHPKVNRGALESQWVDAHSLEQEDAGQFQDRRLAILLDEIAAAVAE